MRFAFRLAAHLGWSLGDVTAMPMPEFCGWLAYYNVEPWGMADRVLTSLGDGGEAVPQSWDEMKATLTGWARGSDGTAEGS